MDIEIKKGRKTGTYRSVDGTKWEVQRLGYVVGIYYNSEGTKVPWEYGKTGLTGYNEKPHIFKTINNAKKHFTKFNIKPETRKYIRPYYYYKQLKEEVQNENNHNKNQKLR